MAKVAPSVLAADFAELGRELERVTQADALHLDVMDGQFVPNISFGPPVIDSIRTETTLPLDVHLMIEQPGQFVERLASADVRTIVVHVEACSHLHRIIDEIRATDVNVGVALNPGTGLHAVRPVLDKLDRVLVMSVDPGFAGQEFLPSTLEKVWTLDETSDVEISVDGGVGPATATQCVEAGADVLVSGSAVFGSDDPGRTVQELQQYGKLRQQ